VPNEFSDVVKIISGENDDNIASKISGNQPPVKHDEPIEVEEKIIVDERRMPFDVATFAREVADKSENKNRVYAQVASNINAYDVSDNCIRKIVYKLLKTPVQSFGDKWLPVLFRATLGSACHDFIQGISKQFTESEISLKIPSIRFSGRLDNLIGNNVLVEIKSCTFEDYNKIIKNQRPRVSDFNQVMTYKYILENHLEEAKDKSIKVRSNKPSLDKYKIDTIQFLYLAHDLTTSDIEDLSTALKLIKSVKKLLNSKRNPFYFITSLVVDTNCFDETPYINYIKDKISQINHYVDTNKLPPAEDKYVNRSQCFFCIYSPICDIKK
jgi:hypothetical protein